MCDRRRFLSRKSRSRQSKNRADAFLPSVGVPMLGARIKRLANNPQKAGGEKE